MNNTDVQMLMKMLMQVICMTWNRVCSNHTSFCLTNFKVHHASKRTPHELIKQAHKTRPLGINVYRPHEDIIQQVMHSLQPMLAGRLHDLQNGDRRRSTTPDRRRTSSFTVSDRLPFDDTIITCGTACIPRSSCYSIAIASPFEGPLQPPTENCSTLTTRMPNTNSGSTSQHAAASFKHDSKAIMTSLDSPVNANA